MFTGMVGCDLEYAFKDHTGHFHPAGVLRINGRKGAPEMMETGGVEVDCCAVELTVPPAADEEEFASNILTHLKAVKARFAELGDLVTIPSHTFSDREIQTARYANEMGCDPDFNVWTQRMNPRPRARGGFRTFGGHVHIENATTDTIKACDLTLGMWSLIEDKDDKRRALYGKAGAYRQKPYGMEYRVLSNFWCGEEEKIRTVYRLVNVAKDIQGDIETLVRASGGAQAIQDIINQNQVNRAREILGGLGINHAA